jgi:Nif-specific regulatory protein
MTDLNTPKDTSLFRLIADQLEALYAVSRVLSQSLNVHETLLEVLKVLDEQGGLSGGMIALEEEETGELLVSHTRGDQARWDRPVRYGRGEGLVGTILAEDQPVVVRRLADEPRFLDRLGIYQAGLPFVGVPIRSGGQERVGVLTAQPPSTDFLPEQVRFLEMVSNLIARIVLLSREVESERRQLEEERDKLRRTVRGNHGFDNIVGHTDNIRQVFDQVRQVAKWNTTVLIRGESGTGKELVANAIHYNSPRSSGPFVKLNCAALPDNLLESELFGHEKGAFTGAVAQRKGRFEQADGGTIFLDEIGEISAAFQAKLLRVLQEGEFERVGGTRTHKVDVRVIAATNRDLEREVEEGVFREDLYYRLNVMPIRMPALRERIEDIPELSSFLVEKIARIQGRPLEITDSAVRLLMRHRWPGNVRELENCLERAAVMCEESKIDRDAIVVAGLSEHSLKAPPAADTTHKVDFNDPDLDERERVIAALEEAGWVQAKAARLLGMTPRQIAYRIQTLNIRLRQI